MRKVLLYISFFFLVQISVHYAQSVRGKWALVQSHESRKVYIDTTSIKQTPRQVNVWTLVKFTEPRNFATVASPVYGIKYNFAFMRGEEKFSLIGAFFCDKKNRLISEQTTPITSLSDFKPVADNVVASFVYSKVAELLSTGKMTPDITVEEKPAYSFKRYSKKGKVDPGTLPEKKPELLSGVTNDSLLQTAVSNSLFNELNEQDKAEETETQDTTLKTPYDVNNPLREEIRKKLKKNLESEVRSAKTDTAEATAENQPTEKENVKYIIPVVDETPVKSSPVSREKETVKTIDKTYDSDNEYNVTDNIWTDGKLYCVQVSAWRSKAKAEKIASELKSVGYNAFVVKAFIPSRGQTWYRVRIGYFSSLDEARSTATAVR